MQPDDQTRVKNAKVWARDPLDWYVEPKAVSRALFHVERFVGDIYDPSCGQGNIVQSALSAGYGAYGSDIRKRTDAAWFTREIDFLETQFYPGALVNIVTNPPFYSGAGTEAFIRKALEFSIGKVAIFASIKFLAGAARASGLFSEHPITRVWIITPRPSCPPGSYLASGGKARGGSDDWVWMVWDRTSPPGVTQLAWLSTKDRT